MHKLKNYPVKVYFPKLEGINCCKLECFSDASFANLPGSGSQGGFIIFLVDDRGNKCPVLWQSRKIRRVVKSTLAAEALALVECAETAIYLQEIISQLSGCDGLPICCHVDNRSLVETLSSGKSVDDKRLRIDLAILKEMLEQGKLRSISWVESSQQLADALTKRGASTQQLRAAISQD